MKLHWKKTESDENLETIDFYNEQDKYVGWAKYTIENNKMLLQDIFLFKDLRGQKLSNFMFQTIFNIARENRTEVIEADIYPKESASCLLREDDFKYFDKTERLIKIFEANGFEVSLNEYDARGIYHLSR